MSELRAGASTDTVEPEIKEIPAPQQSADGDAMGEAVEPVEPAEPAEPADFPEGPDDPAAQTEPDEPVEPEMPDVAADAVQDTDPEEFSEPAAVAEIPDPSDASTSEPEAVTETDVDVDVDVDRVPAPDLEEEPAPDAEGAFDPASEATSGTGGTGQPETPADEVEAQTGLETQPEVENQPEVETDPETQEVDETAARIERPDIERMYDKNAVAVEYGDPIKELGVPLFEGEPGRDQVAQGSLSDCGIVAVIGAAASARPDAIKENLRKNADGTYSITVHEAHYDGKGYVPGERVELCVTQDLPVLKGQPESAAFVSVDRAAWPALLEKAAAGIDETWPEGRRGLWEQDWASQRDYKIQNDETVSPEDVQGPTPSGYGRLNQGTPYYNQAELLTQLTGEPTDLVAFPQGEGAEAEFEQQIKSKLADGKAVVAATRVADAANGETMLPKDLVGGHAYEIVSYDDADGTFTLHNPWNSYQPEPLTANEIVEYCQPKGYPGQYIALR
ncbi:hypothetical protein [Streptomyces sp. NPDC002602]|uniref:hypothetical protein n=1 Tax=Streptomyces sp. NPDC002602 TaxID=3364654 RepID=UPI0036C7A543